MEYFLVVITLSLLVILLSTSIYLTKDDEKSAFKTAIGVMTLAATSLTLGYYIYSNWEFIHPNDEILIDRFLKMDEY